METHIRGERAMCMGAPGVQFSFFRTVSRIEGVDIMGYEKVIVFEKMINIQQCTLQTFSPMPRLYPY